MNSPTTEPLELLRRYRGITALVAAAVFVRVAGLSEWWLNPDEGIYYSLITRASFQGFWSEVLLNAHPPLYYLLLRGLGTLTWEVTLLRSFSVFSGAVAVAGVWAVAHRLAQPAPRPDAPSSAAPSSDAPQSNAPQGDAPQSGEPSSDTRAVTAGFIAAFVAAFAPTAVQMSQVMRPYAFQTALLAWALFFLLSYLRTPTRRWLAGYLTLTCLALLTHYSSVLALGVFGLVVLLDGFRRGFSRKDWREVAAWHLLPLAILVGLYLFHLRPLAASALADEALDGWLLPFMIRSPSDVWLSLLGFQHHLGSPWLRGPLALLLLAGIAYAGFRRELNVLALGAGALLVAMVAASVGAYPFGSTRHAAWVTVFVVPVLGWFVATMLDLTSTTSRRRALLSFGGLLLLGGPIGSLLGADHARWPPDERLLREPFLQAMLPVLDPSAEPELMVMSDQTFNLLLPFYPSEREEAVFSADSSSFHAPFGDRRILVSRTWSFLSVANGRPATDLRSFLQRSDADFPELGMRGRDRFLFVDGGWGVPVAVQLQQLAASGASLVESSRVVPGLHTFVLRTEGLFD